MMDRCCGMWGTWRLSAIAKPLEDTSTSSEPQGYLPTLTSRSRILTCTTIGHGCTWLHTIFQLWCACKITDSPRQLDMHATAQLGASLMPACLLADHAFIVQRAYCAQVWPSTQGLVANRWQLLHDQADAVYMYHHLPLRGLGLVNSQGLWSRRLGRQRLP